jgi:AcrR family transcriptional regulator
MGRTRTTASEARQRLLESADRLFYAQGIRAVGVDAVIADAGVAKATLYAHFPSKDDLILAVLHHREEQVMQFFRTAIERHERRTKDKLRAFFAALRDWFTTPGFRGCAFQNAAAELADADHPGSRFVREHKRRFADFLRELVIASVGSAGAAVVAPIALLIEGAIVSAVIAASPDAADVAREAALKLLAASSKP